MIYGIDKSFTGSSPGETKLPNHLKTQGIIVSREFGSLVALTLTQVRAH